MKKTIGEIVGDLALMLFAKGVFNLDELKDIIGDEYFNELIKMIKEKEAADNGDK